MPNTTPQFPFSERELALRLQDCVRAYWEARSGQSLRQKDGGVKDAGTRGEVTGGQHLNAFIQLLSEIIRSAGYSDSEIKLRSGVELPGYYRPLKKWDMVVVREGRLCAVLELKSQVGPSFGNNFNNRSEEAIGSSADFWVAYREGVLGAYQPWIGYFLLVEDAPRSNAPVRLPNAVFEPMPSSATPPTWSGMRSCANDWSWSGTTTRPRSSPHLAAPPATTRRPTRPSVSCRSHAHSTDT